MKVQITLDDNLVARLDEYAEDNYLSRSGCISLALTQYLNQQDVTKAIKDLAFSMRKIADTGKISAEQMEQLEDMERFAKMLAGG
jgi:metal-responsive CopG/Arc/MetJ family transcriptional regulator